MKNGCVVRDGDRVLNFSYLGSTLRDVRMESKTL